MTDVVVIGASTGGLAAVSTVLGGLPRDFPAPVVVVLHRAAQGPDLLAGLLARHASSGVREAEDKAPLQAGCTLVAPPDYHLLVEPGAVSLSVDEPLHFSRPSIDVLLASAADAYGERAAGVVLTGANADGALGLSRIVERGGIAIVQDPETAERGEMPSAALWAAPEARVLALEQIGPAIVALAAEPERSLP